jgi:hypothetical protein
MEKQTTEKAILVGALILVSMFFVSAADVTINPGECYTLNYSEGVFNATSNQTILQNVTKQFCANSTQSTFCQIDKKIKPGETFKQEDSACNVEIESELDPESFEHEVPILIDGDSNAIRVTIGTETKSFPEILEFFNILQIEL